MDPQKKISLEIRSISSPDIENFWAWELTSNDEVHFLVEMEIGELGSDRADLFFVEVATPEALLLRSSRNFKVIRNRAIIIISRYEWKSIYETIAGIVKQSESNTWRDSVMSLQRYVSWEYE